MAVFDVVLRTVLFPVLHALEPVERWRGDDGRVGMEQVGLRHPHGRALLDIRHRAVRERTLERDCWPCKVCRLIGRAVCGGKCVVLVPDIDCGDGDSLGA